MNTDSIQAPAAEPSSLLGATTLRYLDPQRISFARAGAALRVTLEGEACYPIVKILRLFPLTLPDQYLSLRDRAGNEIGILTEPGRLDAASQALVAAELDRRYVAPTILQILAVKEGFGTVEWHIITNRGACKFMTRGTRETTIVQLSPDRYLLTDIEGNRFDVPDLSALDAASRGYLLRYV